MADPVPATEITDPEIPRITDDPTIGEVDAEVQRVLHEIAETNQSRRQPHDTGIVVGAARGESTRDLATRFKCDVSTVSNVLRHQRPALERLQNLYRARVIARALAEEKEITNGLIDSAKDPENRNQPGAAKALGDFMGLNNRQQDVHIGDNINTFHLDQSKHQTILERPPEEAAKRRRELEERFGLA